MALIRTGLSYSTCMMAHAFIIHISDILSSRVASQVQQSFSAETNPCMWKVLPAFKEFIADWKHKHSQVSYSHFHHVLDAGLNTLAKYYNNTGTSTIFIVNLCKCFALFVEYLFSISSSFYFRP